MPLENHMTLYAGDVLGPQEDLRWIGQSLKSQSIHNCCSWHKTLLVLQQGCKQVIQTSVSATWWISTSTSLAWWLILTSAWSPPIEPYTFLNNIFIYIYICLYYWLLCIWPISFFNIQLQHSNVLQHVRTFNLIEPSHESVVETFWHCGCLRQ